MTNETKRDRAAEEYAKERTEFIQRVGERILWRDAYSIAFKTGWSARDSEVQALREENERLRAAIISARVDIAGYEDSGRFQLLQEAISTLRAASEPK